MTAFPGMLLKMDEVHGEGSHAIFRWIWTGTNTGPGALASPFGSRGTRNGQLVPMA
jgi:hypothetical protein